MTLGRQGPFGLALVYGLVVSSLSPGCGSSDDVFSAAPADKNDAGDSGGAAGAGGTEGGATGGTSGASGSAGASGGSAGSAGLGGGAGGDGGSCPDADGDGETTCAGDCDDSDPNNFSANTEICGDGADNNCNNAPDEICGGLGTFVSSDVGDDNNPGTQQDPVATIGKGLQNAQTIGGGVAVFVAEGHYTEKVTLVEGIDLLGGHQCSTASCTWARDPSSYDSAILAVDAGGVLAGSGITRATRIDGFRIMGQNGAATGRGRAAMTIDGGSPTVTNNRIMGPNVTGSGFLVGRAIGVVILSPTSDPAGPLIESNEITGGNSGSETASGILMESAVSPPPGPTYALIRNNRISGGQGRSTQGIAAWSSGQGTKVVNNEISAGTATTGQAWAIAVGGTMEIDANLINTTSAAGSCAAGNTNWCGGIGSFSSTTTITNNVVLGLNAPLSAAVMLMEAEVPGGVVVLNGNTLDGAGSGGTTSAALVLRIGPCNTCGFNGRIGRVRNNIFLAGGSSARFGVYEDAPAGKTQHPDALENNLFFVRNPTGSDALYRFYDGNAATLLTTAAQVNGLGAQISNLVAANNLASNPLVDATYHLQAGSPAVDKGTATDAPATDLDGDSRPKGAGIDIGADESQ